jgi:membrane fusion protein (multidrug efflux system)
MALRIAARHERPSAALDVLVSAQRQARPVSVMMVEPSGWELWKSCYGEARASKTMDVTPFVREIVDTVHADVGDRVEAGQILISLRREDQAADVQARAAAYDEARSNYKRLQALNKAGGVSQAEVDRAYAAMKAEEAVSQSNRSALGRTKLYSKISGIVTERSVSPGEVAEMGQVLLRIEDPSDMEALLMVSAGDIRGIREDTPVKTLIGGRSFAGKVARISPRAQSGSGLYPVTVKLDPKSGALPGAYIEGSFLVQRMPDAVVIPSSAIFSRGNEQFVYVAEGGDGASEAKLRKVVTGGGASGSAVISSGLEPGDLLITSGNRGLGDGVFVSPETAGAVSLDQRPAD